MGSQGGAQCLGQASVMVGGKRNQRRKTKDKMIWERRTESRRILHEEPKGMANSFWDPGIWKCDHRSGRHMEKDNGKNESGKLHEWPQSCPVRFINVHGKLQLTLRATQSNGRPPSRGSSYTDKLSGQTNSREIRGWRSANFA